MKVYPLTLDRWGDFETLFGENGADGGCWCMWFRLTQAQFAKQKGEGNKAAMHEIVASGAVPGLLAYVDGQAVAWCSLGPREAFPALDRSRLLKRIDRQPVWSIVCFFVAAPYRRTGIMEPFLAEALRYARERGARIVEGYPIEPAGEMSGYHGYTGIVSAFRRAGFAEVARPKPHLAIMRYGTDSPIASSPSSASSSASIA